MAFQMTITIQKSDSSKRVSLSAFYLHIYCSNNVEWETSKIQMQLSVDASQLFSYRTNCNPSNRKSYIFMKMFFRNSWTDIDHIWIIFPNFIFVQTKGILFSFETWWYHNYSKVHVVSVSVNTKCLPFMIVATLEMNLASPQTSSP